MKNFVSAFYLPDLHQQWCVLFFLCFPVVRVGLVTHHFAVLIFLHHSLHLSSSSTFPRSLFRQSSHLSESLTHFFHPHCFFDSDLFGNLSSFILSMCPVFFVPLLTILPTTQASVLIYSPWIFNIYILLSSLFTPAILPIQLFSHAFCLECWTKVHGDHFQR